MNDKQAATVAGATAGMADDPSCTTQEHGAPRVAQWDVASLERAARIFRALADGPRLRLLAVLAGGAACVSELAEGEGENLSTMSQRLKILYTENLVTRIRQGKHIQYALADQHVLELVKNAVEHASEPSTISAEARAASEGTEP